MDAEPHKEPQRLNSFLLEQRENQIERCPQRTTTTIIICVSIGYCNKSTSITKSVPHFFRSHAIFPLTITRSWSAAIIQTIGECCDLPARGPIDQSVGRSRSFSKGIFIHLWSFFTILGSPFSIVFGAELQSKVKHFLPLKSFMSIFLIVLLNADEPVYRSWPTSAHLL